MSSNEISTISDEEVLTSTENEIDSAIMERMKNSDIYFSSNENYTIEDIVYGNVFVSAKIFNLYPKKVEDISGGIISGTLFVAANNVNIQSLIVTNEDSTSSVNPSIIYGNVFAIADKFVLDSECQIYGDLYVIANELEINQNATIRGNVFASSKNFNLAGEIGGDLYSSCQDFELGYNGVVNRDLHLFSQDVILDRYSL